MRKREGIMSQVKTVNGQPVTTYDAQELRDFASAVLRLGHGVTDWEQKFMKDMETKASFSEKQAEIIERIYTDRT